VFNTTLPLINAILNGCAGLFLLWGFVLVKQRKLEAHKKVMTVAFLVSAAFLANYLYYHFNYDAIRFGGQGPIRTLYFTILITHVILATLMVPFILRILWLSWKGQFARHAKLARWVWPVWMYVSVTGVLIYLMLYQWFPHAEISGAS